jgi:hypothetical protein
MTASSEAPGFALRRFHLSANTPRWNAVETLLGSRTHLVWED